MIITEVNDFPSKNHHTTKYKLRYPVFFILSDRNKQTKSNNSQGRIYTT